MGKSTEINRTFMAGESRDLTLPNTLKISPAVKILSGRTSGAAWLLEATGAGGFSVLVFWRVVGSPGFGSTGDNVKSGFEGISEGCVLGKLVAFSPSSFLGEVTDGVSAKNGFTATLGVTEAAFASPVGNVVGVSALLSISMTNPRINVQGVGKFVIHCQKAVV